MEHKIKVLQLGKFFPPHFGGIETFISNLAAGLTSRGVTCDVLCSNKSFKKEVISGSFSVVRTPSIGIVFSLSISPQLIYDFRKISNAYDIIHVHHPDPLSALALWLGRPKGKVVLTWHNDIIRQRRLLFLYRPLQNWLLKRADAIVATSPAYIRNSDSLNRYPEKTHIVPLGVHPITKADDSVVERLRRTFPGKRHFVFSLGRLVSYKGFEYLIHAASYLPEDYQILIGGGGKLHHKLSSMIRKLKVKSRVAILGEIEPGDLHNYYSLCDVFCLPSVSQSEAFGLVLLEAMSLGNPVIATDIKGSGVPWVNQSGVTGINVPIKDPLALAKAITHICLDKKLKKRLGQEARFRYQENFTAETMIENYITLYQRLFRKSFIVLNRNRNVKAA